MFRFGLAFGVLTFCACFESFNTSPFPDLCSARRESNVVSGLARNFTSWSSGLRTRVEVSDDDGGPEVDARDEVQLASQVLIRELECCEK